MTKQHPSEGPGGSGNPDGVRIVAADPAARRRHVVLQLLALLFVGGCIGYAIMPRPAATDSAGSGAGRSRPDVAAGGQGQEAAPAPAAATASATIGTVSGASAPAGSASKRSLTPRRLASKRAGANPPEQEDDAVIKLAPGEQPREITAGEYIQALHDAGIYEGIGAFNPPGTSPPLEGLAVPEDYQLPDGYVRHYQSTDDGQSIEPILMYSPDYEFFDANGNLVPIPDDRVVRPGDAPPGFPIRPIVIPPNREPGELGR